MFEPLFMMTGLAVTLALALYGAVDLLQRAFKA
jgi:hypothetical protein